MKYTLNETKEYLRDLGSEQLKFMTPFVVVDSAQTFSMENYISHPFLSIDLSKTQAGDIIIYIESILIGENSVLLLKNIDKISTRKDRSYWEYLIMKGLKGEDSVFVYDKNDRVEEKIFKLPFSKLRVICTCSKYPDFLRNRIGGLVVDLS